jgi:hypothetical protein
MSASEHHKSESFGVMVSDIDTTTGGSSDSTPPLLREVQRFRQWIFMIPIVAVAAIVWYEFVQQVILDHPQGEVPIPNWLAWVLTVLFGVGLPVLASMIRLITEVHPGRLTVRVAPFRTTTISTDAIMKAVVRQYSALKEYGGWGVRSSRWNGRAYNAYGDKGVQLIVDGKDLILIGSQRPEELLAALRLAGADLDRYDAALEAAEAAEAAEEAEEKEAEEEAGS